MTCRSVLPFFFVMVLNFFGVDFYTTQIISQLTKVRNFIYLFVSFVTHFPILACSTLRRRLQCVCSSGKHLNPCDSLEPLTCPS